MGIMAPGRGEVVCWAGDPARGEDNWEATAEKAAGRAEVS